MMSLKSLKTKLKLSGFDIFSSFIRCVPRFDGVVEGGVIDSLFNCRIDISIHPNLQKYQDLIDLIKEFDFEFHCIVVDKFSVDFDLSKYGNFWQAYCKFLTLLLKYNCTNQQVIPILDFLHKSNKDEDIEVVLNRLDCVANAIQADSRSFPLLQICDILLGAIVFAKKKSYGLFPKVSNKVKARNEFEKHLKITFQIDSLVDNNGTKKANKKFNIWNFKPKKIRDDRHSPLPNF